MPAAIARVRARLPLLLIRLVVALLPGIALAAPPPQPGWPSELAAATMIVVALADKPDPVAAAGASARGYGGLPNYAGSDRAVDAAARLARDYDLREVSAWTIDALHLRCMVYALPPGADRDEVLQRLNRDRRVQLAQPLQEFETFGAPPREYTAPAASGGPDYNDPYSGLQHNLEAIEAAAAQRWTLGEGVEIALIDTGLDAGHPDLTERIAGRRNFVDGAAADNLAEVHGTEVAGIIGAVANNGVGIVGVAPQARLYSYRACWSRQQPRSGASCNSYTLALALGAAIASNARVLNLSLGGPRDPLLEQLLRYALQRGKIVVGAVPPSLRMDGFPLGVRGVIAVSSAGDPRPSGPSLIAPGRNILTLVPGGHFDYASGSSLAAAHVSGAIALLLSLKPRLDSAALYALLEASQAADSAPINLCTAVATLRRADPSLASRGDNPVASTCGTRRND